MDIYSLFILGAFVLFLLILFILIQFLRILVRKQIDDQMKEMIPIKSIRKRVAIRIKWRK